MYCCILGRSVDDSFRYVKSGVTILRVFYNNRCYQDLPGFSNLESLKPMDFAINYSPQAAQLLSVGKIKIDYFKTPPWPQMIAKAQAQRPVAVHFSLRAGNGQLHETDWSEVEHILETTATTFVNLHLAVHAHEITGVDSDNPSPAHTTQIIENLHQDIAAAVSRFGAEKVILENTPYRVGGNRVIQTCVLPDIIREVIHQHECGLLLDISHARIAADALGMDAKEFIQALPMEHLRELHFTGLHDLGGGHLMDHLPVLEADWPWLDWVLEGIAQRGWGRPHMLAFEYGGEGHEFFGSNSDMEAIARDVPRLYGFCHGNLNSSTPQSHRDR
jgi:uncharacterized protein